MDRLMRQVRGCYLLGFWLLRQVRQAVTIRSVQHVALFYMTCGMLILQEQHAKLDHKTNI